MNLIIYIDMFSVARFVCKFSRVKQRSRNKPLLSFCLLEVTHVVVNVAFALFNMDNNSTGLI